MDKSELSNFIKQKIIQKGFHAVGIAPAVELPGVEHYLKYWIEQGYQATMQYLERNIEKRCNASKLVPGARSVIVMLASYKLVERIKPGNPQIAQYAYGIDYHSVLKNKMYDVWDEIKKVIPEVEGRLFTDSAPLHERGYAVEAGLGWIGKNGCLIHPMLGSMVFICEMVVNLELETDQPFDKNHCGKCTRCLDTCPTKAIVEPGIIDSRKCISFLTIENKSEIPENLAQKFTNQLFGCDICQDVCPWNQKTIPLKLFEEFSLNQDLNISLEDWEKLERTDFEKRFKYSPVNRCGWDGFQRNLEIISKRMKLQN
jgi:epoxyqueuosine reductase